jgi:hypothetical protein
MQRIATKCRFIRLIAGLVFLSFGQDQSGIVHANPRIILTQGSQRHVQLVAKASLELRGGSGSSGFGRRPVTTSNSHPFPSSQQTNFPPFTVDDEKNDEATAKEMINAFLTRESRNTFIGTTRNCIDGIFLVSSRTHSHVSQFNAIQHASMPFWPVSCLLQACQWFSLELSQRYDSGRLVEVVQLFPS